MYRLIGSLGTGSAIVEAALTIAGLPFAVEDLEYEVGSADRARLKTINPLGEFPALYLPDGALMTESAAIIFHIDDHAPQAGLVPKAAAPTRDRFLRWLIFIVANIYPTFTYGDYPTRWISDPETAKELKVHTNARAKELWLVVEQEIAARPWFLGGDFSALDLYVAAMTRWRPRMAWFEDHCPKLAGIAKAAHEKPEAAAVWARHFPAG